MSDTPTLLRLDLGSGPYPKPGFEGVDQFRFPGIKTHLVDLNGPHWPFPTASVEEAHCSHLVEHLKPQGRIFFCNELYRVLAPGAHCTVVAPHWASSRAYGDLTHEWPPISEDWFPYLSAQWRALCAPHTDHAVNPGGYSCDFAVSWAPAFREDTAVRHPEYQTFAASHYKDVILDIVATFTKR